jgi:hypothetical protein
MNSTASRRKSLDSAIWDIANRAFGSGFNEVMEAAVKIHPSGGIKRTTEVYLRALAETVRDRAARTPWAISGAKEVAHA